MSKIFEYKTLCILISDIAKLDSEIKVVAEKGFTLKFTESTQNTIILFFEKSSNTATSR